VSLYVGTHARVLKHDVAKLLLEPIKLLFKTARYRQFYNIIIIRVRYEGDLNTGDQSLLCYSMKQRNFSETAQQTEIFVVGEH
jgi:hypothetical protein